MSRQYMKPRRLVVDETGKTYGKLFVTSLLGSYKNSVYYSCTCECGNKVEVKALALRSGNTKSCGCVAREKTAARNTTHGESKTQLYGSWHRMVQRCTDPNSSDYKYYGGRGITVADEWLDFTNFKRDVGDRPPGTSLDRIDNNRGYEPGNVRWATRKEQMQNTRGVKLIEYQGEAHCVAEWERIKGFKPGTLKARLGPLGYSIEEAFTKPVKYGLTVGGETK